MRAVSPDRRGDQRIDRPVLSYLETIPLYPGILGHLEAWLRGEGAIVVGGGLLEDTATVEVSRAQLCQWARNGVALDTGARVDTAFVERVIDEEADRVLAEVGEPSFAAGRFADARSPLRRVSLGDTLPEFLTLPGLALID